jgi:hypothetical protein
MAHQTVKSGYTELVDRLNRFPQGAPPSEVLYAILKLLFSEKEARLVALLPIRPFTVERAARVWKSSRLEARKVLGELASRGVLLDVEDREGRQQYVLPPPMAGFFEFSLMRLHGELDQKLLAELFYQYLNVEEEFIKVLFTDGQTQLGRVFVQETAVPADNGIQVLDYERASEVIATASHRGVGLCYCRHKMKHMDDLQLDRPIPGQARHSPRDGRGRRARPVTASAGAESRPVRRERTAPRQLRLQLLRLLLRGDDRSAAIRRAQPDSHIELHPPDRPRAL